MKSEKRGKKKSQTSSMKRCLGDQVLVASELWGNLPDSSRSQWLKRSRREENPGRKRVFAEVGKGACSAVLGN